jgi:hypothetical protein
METEATAPEPQEFTILENNSYSPPDKITLKLVSPEIGLGVFATKTIKKNTLIERCPLIRLNWHRNYHGDPQLHRYLYTNKGCQCQECQAHGPIMFMVLGYGMLYNHHDSPNGIWNFHFKELYADIIANENIKAGEQILVSYGDIYFSNRDKADLKNYPKTSG